MLRASGRKSLTAMTLTASATELSEILHALLGHFDEFLVRNPVLSFDVPAECFLEGLLSRAWQAWGEFCRACVIKSCLGTSRRSGALVPRIHQALSENHVSAAAIFAKRHGRTPTWAEENSNLRLEPTWGDPDILSRIIINLNPSNSRQLLASFSNSHAISKNVQTIRNGCAHNHHQNMSEILGIRSSYIVQPITHPTHALFWIEPNSNEYFFKYAVQALISASNDVIL